MKKLMWTALVTLASAASAALTARAVDRLWRKAMKEPPPPIPWWARWAVGKPVKAQVDQRLHSPT
jgi:hypothetical protein